MSHINEIEVRANDPGAEAVIDYWFKAIGSKNGIAQSTDNALRLGRHIGLNYNGVISVANLSRAAADLDAELDRKGLVVKVVEKLVERTKTQAELDEEKRRQQDLLGIPRKSREFGDRPSGRVNHAEQSTANRTNSVSEIRDTVAEQRQKEADQMMLDRTKARCEGFSNSRNHAKNFSARKALLATFNELVAEGKSPEQVAAGVDAAIRRIPEPGALSVRGV